MIDFRLYLVTDRARCAPRALEAVVGEAVRAGVRAVQLREKDLARRALEATLARLAPIVRTSGARLLVNRESVRGDDAGAWLATHPSVDGVHVPERRGLRDALRRRGPGRLVGASTHSRERAVDAAAAGVDFVTFGPVFETASKPGAPARGLDALADVCAAVTVPVLAIGGVTPERAAACVEAGAHGVAVIGAVMEAPEVGGVVRAFERALGAL